jgi:hypothetical protein
LDGGKGKVAVKMLKRAVKNSILADYVLMESWFISDYILKAIRSIRGGMLHIAGVCKIDRRKFKLGNKEYNSHTIIKINETYTPSCVLRFQQLTYVTK